MTEAWRDSNYGYRKEITIQDAYIDGDLTDFPVLIAFDNDTDLNTTASKVQADMDDIRFYDGSGNLLKFEVETYSIDGTDATLRAWLKKPSLKASPSGSDNKIWMYYGYGSAANGEDAANVWDANFAAVWHLGDASGGAVDSSANSNDLSDGEQPPNYQQTGKIGYAIEFDDANSEALLRTDTCGISGYPFTQELWIKPDAYVNQTPMSFGDTNAITYQRIFLRDPADNDVFTQSVLSNVGANINGSAYTTGSWIHVAFIVTNATTRELFLNGVTDGTDSTSIAWGAGLDNTVVGGLSKDSLPSHYMSGCLDEIRVSSTNRSATWLKFEYYNISEADFELTWGAEETKPAAGNPWYAYAQMVA